jgi:hypothetical protein
MNPVALGPLRPPTTPFQRHAVTIPARVPDPVSDPADEPGD